MKRSAGSKALVPLAVAIGVGFGLRNIANNFVSGIILLMERSIRVAPDGE
ncbi:MAG: mechanosensitive ion channel [Deltaproteobacteria bacterium]|nr:mechanosensitive ion channel [Deltaproteobacteria bacterium]